MSEEKSANEKLDEIEAIVKMSFASVKLSLKEEARKRYDALLKIRGIIRGVKKND